MLSDKYDHLEQNVILISKLSKYLHQKEKQRKQVFMGTLVSQVLWYLAFVHCIQCLIGNMQHRSTEHL